MVGLEVHCELATETKLFCGCANHFGSLPNTNVCPICMGLPGSLPVLNERAVEYAMRIGLALNCTVNPSIFHRKNYFYPDQTKDYQISQYDEPINSNGYLELPDGSSVGIERAHMEEDTGKSTHVGGGGRIQGADYSLVDYNRAGVPLVEIVSRPDITSSDQARAYVAELRGVLVASGASDGRMEEGSLRVDANVSVREVGATSFGTRCEVKNLNSLRSLGRSIDYEASRQVALVDTGEAIVQETCHWNENEGRTSSMRSKEEANDYRYFPEPDLVPLAPSAEFIEQARAALGALPAERRQRLAERFGGEAAPLEAIATVVELGLDESRSCCTRPRVPIFVWRLLRGQRGCGETRRGARARSVGIRGAHSSRGRRLPQCDPVQGGARRAARARRRAGGDRHAARLRGARGRRLEVLDRDHRREPRRVGSILRRRREGRAVLLGTGDACDQGPRQRQGRRRRARRAKALLRLEAEYHRPVRS